MNLKNVSKKIKSLLFEEPDFENMEWKDCPITFIKLIVPIFFFILVTNYVGFYICNNILHIAEIHYNFTIAYFICSIFPAIVTIFIISYKTNPLKGFGFFLAYILSIVILAALQMGELIESID